MRDVADRRRLFRRRLPHGSDEMPQRCLDTDRVRAKDLSLFSQAARVRHCAITQLPDGGKLRFRMIDRTVQRDRAVPFHPKAAQTASRSGTDEFTSCCSCCTALA